MASKKEKAKRVKVERGLYTRGGSWEACATPPGSRTPKWKVLGPTAYITKTEARRLANEFRTEVQADRYRAPSRLTVAAVADEWIKAQERLRDLGELTENSYVVYERAVRLQIKPYLGERRIAALDGGDLVDWHRDRTADGLAAGSVHIYWAALRAILNYAVRKQYIAANPMATLERRERPKRGPARRRVFTSDEMQRILETAKNEMRLLFAIGIFAGLRLSEALALVWGDIDRDAGVIHVRHQINDRGERVPKLKAKQEGEARDVLLARSLASMLRRAQIASPWAQETDLVITDDGTPMCASTVSERATKTLVNADVPNAVYHDSRRSFVSALVSQGRDIVFVAGQIGDAVQTVLSSYAWMFDAKRHMDAAREQFDAELGHLLGAESA